MSMQSDVSKMLVSRKAASSVISSGGAGRNKSRTKQLNSGPVQSRKKFHANRQPANNAHYANIKITSSRKNAKISPVSQFDSQDIALDRSQLITNQHEKSSTLPYGYTQMKCLEILRRANRPLYTQELHLALGPEFLSQESQDFLACLQNNPRIKYNQATKQWIFVSPYQNLSTPSAILEHLRTKTLEIDKEVLAVNENMTDWINKLLMDHACRAVRGTRLSRCKAFSYESGLFCDLYDPMSRCEACQCLQGVHLYSLGSENLEKLVVDTVLKEIWHKIPPTSTADIMEYTQKVTPQTVANCRESKRKTSSSLRKNRLVKIANAHMCNDDDFLDMFKGSQD